MVGRVTSYPRSYFEMMYEQDPDPWQFESSWYERRKYALTMAALPDQRYHSCFEPGCSVGVLSQLLADRCDRLLSTDLLPAPLEAASRRLESSPGAHVELRAIPEDWPDVMFDLVVLSELAYYFDRPTLTEVTARTVGGLTPGGSVVAAHWRGTTDYPLSGDEAHTVIGEHPGLTRIVQHVEEQFILEVWLRA